jgi:hypothetical protein
VYIHMYIHSCSKLTTIVDPDINDIPPVFFFTASRRHHADVGGILPGTFLHWGFRRRDDVHVASTGNLHYNL